MSANVRRAHRQGQWRFCRDYHLGARTRYTGVTAHNWRAATALATRPPGYCASAQRILLLRFGAVTIKGASPRRRAPYTGRPFILTEPDKTHDEKLSAAQALIHKGDFAAAEQTVDAILAEAPALIDALYIKAVCARYQGDHPRALETLDALKVVAPEYGRAHQEAGHNYFQTGDQSRAITAYRRAVHDNPSLEASWRRLAELHRANGNPQEAARADAQSRFLRTTAPEVVAVMNHVHEGRLHKGEQLCRAFLQKNPKHVDAMRMLADIAARFQVLDEADFLLESAVIFEPDNIPAKLDYIQILRKRQKHPQALQIATELHEGAPEDPVFQSQLAIECMHNNDFEQAFSLFDDVLEKIPGDPTTLTSRGHALKTYGRHDDAVESYRRAYRAMPVHGDAWFGLANLKTYRFTDDEIDLMRREIASDRLSYAARIQTSFSLGKALEDRGDYGEAFENYRRGNDMRRIQSRYDADQMSEELAAQKIHCPPSLFKEQGGKGHDAPDPIFIVGLPRAGSTLLEQILASHSQVDGTMELPNILAAAHKLRGRRKARDPSAYPENLETLDGGKLEELGRKYIEDTLLYRQGAPFFIDKMPNNFRHIALIRLILPNAKIIDARREPMACCFSGFKQLFAEGQEFTYGLTEIGRYYHDYVDLMDHWDKAQPGAVLRVHHEDVLDDLEGQVRRVLHYCGLEFEESCLEFYKTERSVRTASSEQVRRPINRAGVDQWRAFEPYLDPLKEALGSALTEYRR